MEGKEINEKLLALKSSLKQMERVLVAFSGGVDSTLLLALAQEVLGENAIAVTARSCFFPEREKAEARDFCQERGIRQIFVDLDVLSEESVRSNPKDRCYHCKSLIFGEMKKVAEREGISYILEGSNMDDLGDYRPGLRAIEELGILSPLRAASLYKAEIREISREMGLETWVKPSFACLASRFEYGQEITREGLRAVEEAEEMLREMGLSQYRVRVHGRMARLELFPEEFPIIMNEEKRIRVVEKLKDLGFTYVSLDLQGYSSGSMNYFIEDKKDN